MQFATHFFSTFAHIPSALLTAFSWIRRTAALLLGLAVAASAGPVVQAQPKLVEDHFSGNLSMEDPVTITEGGVTKLCFFATIESATASAPRAAKTELFCYNGSSLTQRSNFRGPRETVSPEFDGLTSYDGGFYFSAFDSDLDGEKLWKYDNGTSAEKLAENNIDVSAGWAVYQGTLYFQADGKDNGEELWQYDGSSVSQAADIFEGKFQSSQPEEFAVYNGELYFQADGGSDGIELWKYDGSSATQAADINSGSGDSRPADLTVYDGNLYFQADGGSDGEELWTYDGSSATQVADINSGSEDSKPTEMAVYDGALYFRADGGSDGKELWKYNGSSPTQVADIYSGSSGSNPAELTVYNGSLYFQTGITTKDLRVYDGTSVSQVQELATSEQSLPSLNLTVYENTLYFNSRQSSGISSYDGSSVNESPFTNNMGNRGITEKTVYQGDIYFTAEVDNTGRELWRYDGSSFDQVADIRDGPSSSNPKYLTVYDGSLYFQADGGEDGEELWSYDGTSVTQVANIWGGTYDSDSSPAYLTVYDGELYFEAQAGDDGEELWSYDGRYALQAADINSGFNGSSPSHLTVHDGSLYFQADGGNDGKELWKYDGSSATQAADINSGSGDSSPTDLTVYDGNLYFRADGGSDGGELWTYDGSSAEQVEDINSGSSWSLPTEFAVFDGVLYFQANGGNDGKELWSYDGTSVEQVRDIHPGGGSSIPTDLTAFGNKLYFVAKNGSDGWEPHAYTGKSLNSLNFAPGRVSGEGFDPVTYDDGSGEKLYVTANNGVSGRELYRIGPNDPLPVELASLDATYNGEKVRLSWQTASETNNASFRIQRKAGASNDGVKASRRDASTLSPEEGEGAWTTVGNVEGAGTTSEAQRYRFTDEDLPYEADALTYRLKQVDTDGSANYSKMITVERGVSQVQLLGTAPNPARKQATVRYALPEKQDSGSSPEQRVTIQLYNVLGQQVQTVVNSPQTGRHERTLDVSDLSSGVYFLRLQTGGEVRTQKLTVVQ